MKPIFITVNEYDLYDRGNKRINANAIVQMEGTNIKIGHAGTLIKFIGGSSMRVMETQDEIEELIRESCV